MKKLIPVVFLFFHFYGFSQEILVKLFSSATLNSSWVTTHNGDYFLIATDYDFNPIDTIEDIFADADVRTLLFKKQGKKVEVLMAGKSFGKYSGLLLMADKQESHFIIKGKGKERIYGGHLKFRLYKNALQIISEVNIEDYVAGVVESEGGHINEFEYFKAQAVLARTWVLKNMKKHISDGYNVKDNITSQAYYSKAYLQHSAQIYKAVKETKGLVLYDKKGGLVFGAFCSNSGGQTSNSEDIWSRKIDYLRSVPDSFSLKGSRAFWEKEVSKTEFIKYFAGKLSVNANDKKLTAAIGKINMDSGRRPWFLYNGKKVKMRDVRTKFKLKSSFFTVVDKGDKYLLKGKGFGHGVGLSQQGAMEMSKQGFDYKQILEFYFKETVLKKYVK